MAQITIDTEKDSARSMKKIIELLEHFIAEKNGDQIMSNASSDTGVSANPFAMFGDQSENSTTRKTELKSSSTPSTATNNEDLFSMFSSDTPSSSPQAYGSSSTTIQSSEISAQDLLKSVDETEDSDVEVKKDQDFFQLMHY